MNEASGVPSLSANRIESLEVTIPDIDEQDKITNALSSIDKHVSTLDALATAKSLTKIDVQALHEAGLVAKKDLVKILGNGALSVALEVTAHAFSKKAEEAIVAAGGTVVKVNA